MGCMYHPSQDAMKDGLCQGCVAAREASNRQSAFETSRTLSLDPSSPSPWLNTEPVYVRLAGDAGGQRSRCMYHPEQDAISGAYCWGCAIRYGAAEEPVAYDDPPSDLAPSRLQEDTSLTTDLADDAKSADDDPARPEPIRLESLDDRPDECAFHPGTPAAGGLCADCAAKAAELSAAITSSTGESPEGKGVNSDTWLVTEYGRANTKPRAGDGLDGDEFLLHGWLKAQGVTGKKRSKTKEARQRFNASVLMPEKVHDALCEVQRTFGLHDAKELSTLSINDVVTRNLKCLEIVGVDYEVRRRVVEHAMEQVPALMAQGIKYW